MRKIAELIRDQNPLVLSPDMTVQQACELMRQSRAGAVLITATDGGLAGIFTRIDAINRVLAEGKSATETMLGDVMTTNPRTIAPTTTALDALRIMEDCGFRHLPVVSQGKILGVIFRGEFSGVELDLIEEEVSIWERIR